MYASSYVPTKVLTHQLGSDNKYYVAIAWDGFSELESTWEPLDQFYTDCPELVREYLTKHPGKYSSLYDAMDALDAKKSKDVIPAKRKLKQLAARDPAIDAMLKKTEKVLSRKKTK